LTGRAGSHFAPAKLTGTSARISKIKIRIPYGQVAILQSIRLPRETYIIQYPVLFHPTSDPRFHYHIDRRRGRRNKQKPRPKTTKRRPFRAADRSYESTILSS
jgi:hypothetical protein